MFKLILAIVLFTNVFSASAKVKPYFQNQIDFINQDKWLSKYLDISNIKYNLVLWLFTFLLLLLLINLFFLLSLSLLFVEQIFYNLILLLNCYGVIFSKYLVLQKIISFCDLLSVLSDKLGINMGILPPLLHFSSTSSRWRVSTGQSDLINSFLFRCRSPSSRCPSSPLPSWCCFRSINTRPLSTSSSRDLPV